MALRPLALFTMSWDFWRRTGALPLFVKPKRLFQPIFGEMFFVKKSFIYQQVVAKREPGRWCSQPAQPRRM